MVPVGDTASYWSTMAQLAAVIGLTAVLEARFTVRRWTRSTPGWERIYDGISIALTILSIYLTIVFSMAALASGAYASWWVLFTSVALGLGLTLVLVNPGWKIVRATFARQIASAARSRINDPIESLMDLGERVVAENLQTTLEVYETMEELADQAATALADAERDGADAATLDVLRKSAADREADLENWRTRLGVWNKQFDAAAEVRRKVREAEVKTNEAAADAIVDDAGRGPGGSL